MELFVGLGCEEARTLSRLKFQSQRCVFFRNRRGEFRLQRAVEPAAPEIRLQPATEAGALSARPAAPAAPGLSAPSAEPAGGEGPLGSSASSGGAAAEESRARLKGSIGEGSNQTNFAQQSSVKIQYILLENSKNS